MGETDFIFPEKHIVSMLLLFSVKKNKNWTLISKIDKNRYAVNIFDVLLIDNILDFILLINLLWFLIIVDY